MNPYLRTFLLILFVVFVLNRRFRFIEKTTNYFFNYFKYFSFSKKKLSQNEVLYLQNKTNFYSKLKPKYKKYFEHRVASFIENYKFIGRENLEITHEIKLLIASTSVMLTFGFKNYLYKSFDKIIVYPNVYFSTKNQENHKGEFNPSQKAIVFSWKHFLESFETKTDNLNLGIHEFAHVMHLESLKNKKTTGINFVKNMNQLFEEVSFPKNREIIINSGYIRNYAFTNQFEFVAVLIENFYETPAEFKKALPPIYNKVKEMLNYNEAIFITNSL